MRQVAPRHAAPRLDTELAAPGAKRRTMLRHGAVRLQACELAEQQPSGMAGLTCCTGGKSRQQAPRNRTSASVKGGGEGTFFLVRAPEPVLA
jgi:hypothetical protein